MKLLDRRFLNISLTVLGVHNSPDANPATGTQYIVGSNPSGAFASASPNQIARFDGSDWSFTTPKAGELEVLNLDTGEILQFNGEDWDVVASLGGDSGSSFSIPVVDDIVYGYHDENDSPLSPANLKALRGRYLLINEGGGYIKFAFDNFLNSGTLSTSMSEFDVSINEGDSFAYAGFGDGKIHLVTYDATNYEAKVTSTNLHDGEYIFNKAENALYYYDATNHKFVKVGGQRHYIVDALIDYVGTSLPAAFNSGYASFVELIYGGDASFKYMKQGSTEFSFMLNPGFSFANIHSLLADEAGIYSVPANTYNIGVHIIHDLYDGDSIFNRADGCTYIFKDDGNNKSFVKASDSFITPVLDILPTGNSLPDYPTASGDKFLRISGDNYIEAYVCTAVSRSDWGNSVTVVNGSRYASTSDHKIYEFKEVMGNEYSYNVVILADIPVGVTFFNNADNSLYFYNGTDFVKLNASGGSAAGFYEPIAPVLDILNIGSNQPDYPSAAGDKFIFYDPDESQAYGELYIAPSSANWGNGTNISAGQRYASLNEHKIYVFQGDGNEAIISDIPVGATFLNKNDNCLYTFDGSSFVKSASYEPVAPVLAIIPSGSTLPATAATGDAFLNTSNAKLYTATAANTWDSGTLTANGSRYASSTDYKIYVSNGTALTATNILNGDLFLNKEENIVYAYDDSVPAFVKVGTSSLNITTENHSLTAADVNAKSFSLSNNIAAGQESNTLLFVSGIAQTVGVDFSASGNSISWNNKALDDIALTAGDSFLVQYIRG